MRKQLAQIIILIEIDVLIDILINKIINRFIINKGVVREDQPVILDNFEYIINYIYIYIRL